MNITPSITQRFESCFTKGTPEECWIWQRPETNGYGQISIYGMPRRSNRVSWELYRGPIPDGLWVDHSCGNTLCVNPDHLKLITPGERITISCKPELLRSRFEACFKKGSPDECWEWKAGKNGIGYGELVVNKHPRLAHRISYELYKGEIPKGLCVTHVCDHPSCVNYHHLVLGTKGDNIRDCVKKGRHKPPMKGKTYYPFERPVKYKYKHIGIGKKSFLAHRVIMERHLGRKLASNEWVYHINGNTLDNRIENLQVMPGGGHNKFMKPLLSHT